MNKKCKICKKIKKHYAKGMCNACYLKDRYAKNKDCINLQHVEYYKKNKDLIYMRVQYKQLKAWEEKNMLRAHEKIRLNVLKKIIGEKE
jgi:hypothetical protein